MSLFMAVAVSWEHEMLLVSSSKDGVNQKMLLERLASTWGHSRPPRSQRTRKLLPACASAWLWWSQRWRHRRLQKHWQFFQLAFRDSVCSLSRSRCRCHPQRISCWTWKIHLALHLAEISAQKLRNFPLWRRCYRCAPAVHHTVQRFQQKVYVPRLMFWHSQLLNCFYRQVKFAANQQFSAARRGSGRWILFARSTPVPVETASLRWTCRLARKILC